MARESSGRHAEQATPFDIFIGRWTGIANVFSRKGAFLHAFPAEILMRWESAEVMSYVQLIGELEYLPSDGELCSLSDEQLLKTAPKITRVCTTMTYKDNILSGGNADYSVEGIASAPGIFLFTVRSLRNKLVYSNLHYLLSANNRQVMGPTLLDGNVVGMNVHAYTRIG